jgi:MFS family permease
MFNSLKHPGAWAVTLTAAGILMITMGMRQSIGLYVSPINTSTGLGIVTLSLALAIGQFVWGAIQPIAGALADRHGPRGVLFGGVSADGAGFGDHTTHDQRHGPSHHAWESCRRRAPVLRVFRC